MTNYIIKKDGKRYGKKLFDSYESARSYVRKILRKSSDVSPWNWDAGWTNHNNPSHGNYGFNIEKR